MTNEIKQNARDFFLTLQQTICSAIEGVDGKSVFTADTWEREDLTGKAGGGGISSVLKAGSIFEQAGVNFSEVFGTLPAEMSERLLSSNSEVPFYATGISLVLHPYSPIIPTTHANFRFIEAGDKSWFGGGIDLTPYYLFPDDVTSFHRTIKSTCDKHNLLYYQTFKDECDRYFYLPHRKEHRGVGGVFFDYLGKENPAELPSIFSFVKDMGETFLPSYLPIVECRKNEPWTEKQKHFQLLRRGRYVEFNLLYDRGTLFGLKTGGRTESILMSLPPEVRFEYNYAPTSGSQEEELLEVIRTPRDWC